MACTLGTSSGGSLAMSQCHTSPTLLIPLIGALPQQANSACERSYPGRLRRSYSFSQTSTEDGPRKALLTGGNQVRVSSWGLTRKGRCMGRQVMTSGIAERDVIAHVIGVLLNPCSIGNGSVLASERECNWAGVSCQHEYCEANVRLILVEV
jgi:hypothetical protein